jgi:hypoxanthine phosphoribosyltransferase
LLKRLPIFASANHHHLGNITIQDKVFKPYLNAVKIQARVAQLAEQITSDYHGCNPVFLGILNGAFMFCADLMKGIRIPAEMSFVKLASYSGTHSTGKVLDLIGLDTNLAGKRVIIVEDIVDSGTTLAAFLPVLNAYRPQDIAICSLLVKPAAMKHQLEIHYCGFEIPNDFIVGYGLDYNGFGRNLKDIYVIVS